MRIFLLLSLLLFCVCAQAHNPQLERFFQNIILKHPEQKEKLEALQEFILDLRPGRGITVGTISCLGDMSARYMISSVGVVVYFIPAYDAKYNSELGYNSIIKTRLSNSDREIFNKFPLISNALDISNNDIVFNLRAKEPVLLNSFISNSELKKLWEKKGIKETKATRIEPPHPKENVPSKASDPFFRLADFYLANNDDNYKGGSCYYYTTNRLLKRLFGILEQVLEDEIPIELLFGTKDGKPGLFSIAHETIKNDYNAVSVQDKLYLDAELKKLTLRLTITPEGQARANYQNLFDGILFKMPTQSRDFELFLYYLDGASLDIQGLGFGVLWGTKAFVEDLYYELSEKYREHYKLAGFDIKLEDIKSSEELLLIYLNIKGPAPDDLFERVLFQMRQDLKVPDSNEYRSAIAMMDQLVYVSKSPKFLFKLSPDIKLLSQHLSIFVERSATEIEAVRSGKNIVGNPKYLSFRFQVEKFRTSIDKMVFKK